METSLLKSDSKVTSRGRWDKLTGQMAFASPKLFHGKSVEVVYMSTSFFTASLSYKKNINTFDLKISFPSI